ncbi:MAG: hypothetical protein FWC39_10295 [Bacteroidetes bacterium]|nr:hypothetical protein [Bacteroidota bacterium]
MKNKKTKQRIKIFDSIAIIAMLGIIAWIVTDFFGGMFIWFVSYPLVIIPVIILFVVSFVETITSVIKRGIHANRIKLTAHSMIIVAIIILNVYNSELFKSKQILKAALKDDLFYYTLIFRENGNVENRIDGVFGYTEIIKGTYFFKGDTIIFSKKPYKNDFLPDTLLIDRNQGVIFITQNKNGQFSTEVEWLNHFKIIE